MSRAPTFDAVLALPASSSRPAFTMATTKVLCVCLGNICRSPAAEAILQHLANEHGVALEVDSCGTAGYHVGERPDPRTIEVCKKNNVPINSRCRQLKKGDFDEFDIIIGSASLPSAGV